MTRAERHHVVTADWDFKPYSGGGRTWFMECSCHNPDGEGVGRADFYADTLVEAINLWADHLLEVEA